MNAKAVKEIRKETRKITGAAEHDIVDVMLYLMSLPFRARLKYAWTIIKGRRSNG